MPELSQIERLRLNADLMRLVRERATIEPGPTRALMLARNAAQITAKLQALGLKASPVSIYNSSEPQPKDAGMTKPLTLDELTAQAETALEKVQPNPKFGTRETTVSMTAADGSTITCTASDVYVQPWKRRGGAPTIRKTQYKQDGKVVSKATLLDVLGGKAKQEINEALRAAFEAYAPVLAHEYSAWIERAYAHQKEQHGGTLPAYPPSSDPGAQVIRQTLTAHCRTVPGPSGIRGGRDTMLVLDEEKLAQVAKEYGEQACLEWFYKTNAKLGPLEDAELHRSSGGDVEVTGKRSGHDVRMSQQRILKATQAGRLFHQFPARLYVDGKFMPEAIYAKLFAGK